MIRNYSNGIWYFNLRPDFETTKVMPKHKHGNEPETRITQCENGVLITGNGYIRWVSNDFFTEEYIRTI